MIIARSRVAGLAAAAALLFAAACGGDDGDADADATDTTAAETTEAGGGGLGGGGDTTVTTETEDPVETDVDLASTAHYAGFVYSLTGAAVAPDAGGVTTVTVEFDVENASPDAATPFPSQPTLELEDGTGITGDYETSEIPAGGNGTGSFTFALDGEQAATIDLATTTLIFGDSDTTKVELLLDDSEQQALAPIDLGDLGELTSAEVTMTIESATLRWDVPASRNQAPEGDAYIVLVGTLANAGDALQCASDSFTLTAPDGVDETQDDDYNCIQSGETLRDASVTFLVQSIETGTYTVTFDAFPGDDTTDPQTVEIEVDLDAEPGTTDDGDDDGEDGDGAGDEDEDGDDSTTTEG